MKNKVFGLDIGATSIKAAWIDKQPDGYVMNSVIDAPSPEKGMLSESVFDQETMARAIEKLLDDGKIDTRAANIALPENQVYTKVVEMPALSDKELSSAIYWEAEQYIPVPLDKITLDYKVLRRPAPNDPNQQMDVLLVGAPTSLIEKYERILGLAGISVAAIETEILSVIRSVVTVENFPTSLIVNIGAINTSMAIVRQNILAFTYFVPTGGLAISRAIAADFGFSIQQAEEYKKTYGLSDVSLGGKIGKVTEPIISLIIEETKKAIAFYSKKFPDEQIKQIILSGGTAKLPGINSYFVKNTNIETLSANPWKILSTQNLPKDIIENAPSYTISVGLAIREYE